MDPFKRCLIETEKELDVTFFFLFFTVLLDNNIVIEDYFTSHKQKWEHPQERCINLTRRSIALYVHPNLGRELEPNAGRGECNYLKKRSSPKQIDRTLKDKAKNPNAKLSQGRRT